MEEAKLDHKAVSALFTKFDGQVRRAFSLLLASWKVDKMAEVLSDAIAGVGQYAGDPRKIIVQTAETWGTRKSGVMGREIERVEKLEGSGKFGTKTFRHGEMDLSPLAALKGYLENDYPVWAWKVIEIPRVREDGGIKMERVIVRAKREGVWRMRPDGKLQRRFEGPPVQAVIDTELGHWMQQSKKFGSMGWEPAPDGNSIVLRLPVDDRKEATKLFLKIEEIGKGNFGNSTKAKMLTRDQRESLSASARKAAATLRVAAGGWLDSQKQKSKDTLKVEWVDVDEPLGELEAPPDKAGRIWVIDPKMREQQLALLAQADDMKKMVRFSPIDSLKRKVRAQALAKLTEQTKSDDPKMRAHAQQALKNGAYKLGEYTGRNVVLDDDVDDAHEVRYKKISAKDTNLVYEDYKRNRNAGVVISNKGGTGLDFHADIENDNPLPVLHTVLNFGEAVDDEVQKLGRGLRTGRIGVLEFVLFRVADFVTELRQTGAIGAKLGEMGAMQSGDRHQSAGGEVVRTEDDFMDEYFVDAFEEFVSILDSGAEDNPYKEFPFSAIEFMRDQMGYETGTGNDNEQLEKALEKPTPNNILNRLARTSGKPGSGWELVQNYVLREVLQIRDKIVADLPEGEREGMKTLTGEMVSLRAIDPKTGEETGGPRRQPLNIGDNAFINQVTVIEKAVPKDWRMAVLMDDSNKPYRRVWRKNVRGEREAILVWENDRIMAGPNKGDKVARWWSVYDKGTIRGYEYDAKDYPAADGVEWQEAWDKTMAEERKIKKERFFVSGWRANLALMDELKTLSKTGGSVYLVRPTTASGDEEFIGREILRGNKNTATRAGFDAFMAKYASEGRADESGDVSPLTHAAGGGMVVVDGMKGIGLTSGKSENGRQIWIVPGPQRQNRAVLARAGFQYSTRKRGAHWWADGATDAAELLLSAFPQARALDDSLEKDQDIAEELGLVKGRASFPRADSMLERFGLPGGQLTLRQDANGVIRADDLPIRIQPGSAVAKGLELALKKSARTGAPLKIAAAGHHGRRIIQYALDENPAPARQWVARRFQGGAKGFAVLDGHQKDLDAVAEIRAEVEAEVRRLLKRMGGGEERMQLEFPEIISHRTDGGRVLYAAGWTGGGLIRLAWTLGGDRGRAAADVVATAAHEFNDAMLWDMMSDFHRKRATYLAQNEWLKDESIAERVKKSLAASGETGDADAEAREAFSYALEGYAAGQFKARRSGSFLKKILDGLRALGIYLRGKFSSLPSAEAMFEFALRGDFLKASVADNAKRADRIDGPRLAFGADDLKAARSRDIEERKFVWGKIMPDATPMEIADAARDSLDRPLDDYIAERKEYRDELKELPAELAAGAAMTGSDGLTLEEAQLDAARDYLVARARVRLARGREPSEITRGRIVSAAQYAVFQATGKWPRSPAREAERDKELSQKQKERAELAAKGTRRLNEANVALAAMKEFIPASRQYKTLRDKARRSIVWLRDSGWTEWSDKEFAFLLNNLDRISALTPHWKDGDLDKAMNAISEALEARSGALFALREGKSNADIISQIMKNVGGGEGEN